MYIMYMYIDYSLSPGSPSLGSRPFMVLNAKSLYSLVTTSLKNMSVHIMQIYSKPRGFLRSHDHIVHTLDSLLGVGTFHVLLPCVHSTRWCLVSIPRSLSQTHPCCISTLRWQASFFNLPSSLTSCLGHACNILLQQ